MDVTNILPISWVVLCGMDTFIRIKLISMIYEALSYLPITSESSSLFLSGAGGTGVPNPE